MPLESIPADLYCWPTSRSYTRQPVVEVHTLGSPPILSAVATALTTAGARLAEPGEFTLRAFLAGRLDLTQAEAVLGVIDARGRMPLDAALAQLAGGLSAPLHQLRDTLLDALAQVEAGLDFVDEDIEFISPSEIDAHLLTGLTTIETISQQLTTRGTTTELPRVVLVGQPNVGKSSLFNALAGKPVAITSPQSGTTRDYVTQVVDADGVRFQLIDTAGLDASEGEDATLSPDQVAQAATRHQRAQADVQVWCFDATYLPDTAALVGLCDQTSFGKVVVVNKCDLATSRQEYTPAIGVSALTGTGLAELKRAIAGQLAVLELTGAVTGTAERCRDSLRLAADSLERARMLVADTAGDELIAAEVRTAITELGRVVGAVYTEDLLDRIFSQFCIGK
jgi:tRNA modification GTPase